jgi:anti-sigma B factor antagonist
MSLINVKREGTVAIVELLIQRLDASMAVPFKSAMVGLVNDGERKLVLDLGKVEFIDSSGLGAMVSILKALGEKGTLSICSVRPNVMSLFKLTRMDKVFAILPDTSQAVAKLAS